MVSFLWRWHIVQSIRTLSVFLCVACLIHCSTHKEQDGVFELKNKDQIGINFTNQLTDKAGHNIFSFRNYYNGGGVGIGDINNDGLDDVFLTSNQGDNQLYLNLGNWKFENISDKAGIKGTKFWSTGVTFVDINNDGWLDIYVCNSGNTKGKDAANELFINLKNNTFKDSAESYGLADIGLSTHAAFFDYDLDGDLDCYILNNSFRPIESFDFRTDLRKVVDTLGGDRLYRNDKQHFTNVTQSAGIYSSDIGFGLGLAVVDMNRDGYPDIYVSNDFFERDYLYINQKNGTFKEDIQTAMRHLSLASMGSDIADINNDGYFDLFTTEMLPEDDRRLKKNTAFENYDLFHSKQKDGYYNQLMQNCLQLNNGDGTFTEIAAHAGVMATDWSWGALFFDMDNDGWQDIFVSNGIYKDLTDQDYIEFLGNKEMMSQVMDRKTFNYRAFIDKMNSIPISNYAYMNNKNLTFTNHAARLKLNTPSFSNGSAYGDLDNDGDLDLVVNNLNMPVFVYENKHTAHHYIKIKLEGSGKNTNALGSFVYVYLKDTVLSRYHQAARGFQSCISPQTISIGVGVHKVVDSVVVVFPNGTFETQKNLSSNHTYTFTMATAKQKYLFQPIVLPKDNILKESTTQLFTQVPQHQENLFLDFDREKLMLQMQSNKTPFLVSADFNGDHLEDLCFGHSKGTTPQLYMQTPQGTFVNKTPTEFKKFEHVESTAALAEDMDNDGDIDLFFVMGGNEEDEGSQNLLPRLFVNDGKGHFTYSTLIALPLMTHASVIRAADFDHDGLKDIFIGGGSRPFMYGAYPPSYLLKNEGYGQFKNVSNDLLDQGGKIGMVKDAQWQDVNGDGFPELIVVGHWMGIQLYQNMQGKKFVLHEHLNSLKGFWNCVTLADINQDGRHDILVGNIGTNSKLKASVDEPIRILVKDFDDNGTPECLISLYRNDHQAYTYNMRQDVVAQMPKFKKKFLTYDAFAGQPFDHILPPNEQQGAEEHSVNTLSSLVIFQDADFKFSPQPLPTPAQLSSVKAIVVHDFNHDNSADIVVLGNDNNFKPEFGILDGNYGQVYHHQNKQLIMKQSLHLRGSVNSAISIALANKTKALFIGINNGSLKAFEGVFEHKK